MTDFTTNDAGEMIYQWPPAAHPRSIIPLVSMREYLMDRGVWKDRCREAFQNARTSEASRLFLVQHTPVRP